MADVKTSIRNIMSCRVKAKSLDGLKWPKQCVFKRFCPFAETKQVLEGGGRPICLMFLVVVVLDQVHVPTMATFILWLDWGWSVCKLSWLTTSWSSTTTTRNKIKIIQPTSSNIFLFCLVSQTTTLNLPLNCDQFTTIYTPGWRETMWSKVSCLRKQNRMIQGPKLEPPTYLNIVYDYVAGHFTLKSFLLWPGFLIKTMWEGCQLVFQPQTT